MFALITEKPPVNFTSLNKTGKKTENKQNNSNADLGCMPKFQELGMYQASINKKDIDSDVFFIQMAWYKKNKNWAQKMKELTLETSKIIKAGEDFETVLKNIENNISKINQNELFAKRTNQKSYYSIFEDGRGEEYFSKYKERLFGLECLMIQPPKDFCDANTVEISSNNYRIHIIHHKKENKTNLDMVKTVYEELRNTESPSLDEILEKIATIRWLIAQESPYYRGNESVCSVLERALMDVYGIKNIKYKKFVSPDFEAFYRTLDEFISIYPKLFEEKIDFVK